MKTPSILRDIKIGLVEAAVVTWQVAKYAAISFKERVLHGITLRNRVQALLSYLEDAHAATGMYGFDYYSGRIAEIGYLAESYPDLAKTFEKALASTNKPLMIQILMYKLPRSVEKVFESQAHALAPLEIAVLYFNTLEKAALEKAGKLHDSAKIDEAAHAQYFTLRLAASHEIDNARLFEESSLIGRFSLYLWVPLFLACVIFKNGEGLAIASLLVVFASFVLILADMVRSPRVIPASSDWSEATAFQAALNSSQLSSVHLKWFVALSRNC